MRDDAYQLRFDDGHQQRYFPDRGSVLACVLRVSKQTPYPRFEIWRRGEPVRLRDGRTAGARYELVEVLDARDPGLRRRILDELHALDHNPNQPAASRPQEGGGAATGAAP